MNMSTGPRITWTLNFYSKFILIKSVLKACAVNFERSHRSFTFFLLVHPSLIAGN